MPADYAGLLAHLAANAKEVPIDAALDGMDPVGDVPRALAQACEGVGRGDREAAIEGAIEQLYSYIRWRGRVAIVVYTEERQGFGDIMLGLKTAELFRDGLARTANQYDVAFVVDKRTRKRVANGGADYGIEPVVLPAGDRFTPPSAGAEPQLLVRAPTMQSAQQLERLRNYKCMFGPDTKELAFTEYARKEPDSVPSGLKPQELGVTIHQELSRYREELTGLPKPQRPQFRAGFLAGVLTDKVFNAIAAPLAADTDELAGMVADKDRVEPAVVMQIEAQEQGHDVARNERAVIQPAERAALYFGYSNRSGTKFIKTVVALERGKGRHVCIVHPGGNYLVKYWPQMLEEIKGDYRKRLQEAGFGAVEVVVIPKQKEGKEKEEKKQPEVLAEIVQTGGKGPRTLRIVLPHRVASADMIALFRAGEPFSITTGNQSTSEALSAGKTILYECLAFTQNQHFMEDLFEMGRQVVDKPGGHNRFREFYKASLVLSGDILSKGKSTVSTEQCEAVAELVAEPELVTGFEALGQSICATKDLRRRLLGTYIRQRLRAEPTLVERLDVAEALVGTGACKAENFEALAKALGAVAQGE